VGDITDPSAVAAATEGVDAVVHMASLLHVINPSPALRSEYERVNVGGTGRVVEAARRTGVGRLVFFSTIAVYGSSTAVLTEESSPAPDSLYAETKLAAERTVLTARRPDGHPLGTVLRLAAVYGGRVKGNYRRLLLALARKRFIRIGAGLNRRTLVYDRDVARAALLALEHPRAAGRVFNVSDGKYHSINTIVAEISASLGQMPPRWSLPVSPVRVVAGIIENAARLAGRHVTIGRAAIDKYCEEVTVSSLRIQQELGFVPRYDLAAGWRETVQDLRRQCVL
jgi:UDP-glucose 4-epimerase